MLPERFQKPQYQVLPHAVFSNTARAVILIEAKECMPNYVEMCRKAGCYALVVHSTKGGQSEACVVKGSAFAGPRIEAVRHHDVDSDNFGWLLHAVEFRIIWGEKNRASAIDRATGVRTQTAAVQEAENTDQTVQRDRNCLVSVGAPLKRGDTYIKELKNNASHGSGPPDFKRGNTLQVQRSQQAACRVSNPLISHEF